MNVPGGTFCRLFAVLKSRTIHMGVAVRTKDLTKIYRLYHGPRSMVAGLLFGRPPDTEIVALDNISVEVEEGEAFGVIGDNGAGKSTLLKILTGTAVPTRGEVQVQGRATALLEVGVGFHPDFTGRENLYFTGALMGLAREEIAEREGEIVAFSELGSFIDEPVKTYSSGMYVRLGFAVATGFDFSILIIDEALAVGDQGFQKKCTDRIAAFRKAGKTILFCSHNLYQVRTLCERALWLERGHPIRIGPAREVVTEYESSSRTRGTTATESVLTLNKMVRDDRCRVESVTVLDEHMQPVDRIHSGETFCVRLEGWFGPGFAGTPALGLSLLRDDTVVYTTSTAMDGVLPRALADGRYTATIRFRKCPLLTGRYEVHAYATDEHYLQAYDAVVEAAFFTVVDEGPDTGLVRLEHDWIN